MTDWAPEPRWSGVWASMDRATYDKAMSRLRVSVAVLSVVQLSLIARLVVDGLTVTVLIAEGTVVPLLICALILWRQGRRLGARGRSRPRARRQR